jgi:hypothetical protein
MVQKKLHFFTGSRHTSISSKVTLGFWPVGIKLCVVQQSCFVCSAFRRLYTKVRVLTKSSGTWIYRLNRLAKQNNRTHPFIFHFYLRFLSCFNYIYIIYRQPSNCSSSDSSRLPSHLTQRGLADRPLVTTVNYKHVQKPMVLLQLLLRILHAQSPNLDPELRPGNFRASRAVKCLVEEVYGLSHDSYFKHL